MAISDIHDLRLKPEKIQEAEKDLKKIVHSLKELEETNRKAKVNFNKLIIDLESVLEGFNMAVKMVEEQDPEVFKRVRLRARVKV
jgi:hypothetical protein